MGNESLEKQFYITICKSAIKCYVTETFALNCSRLALAFLNSVFSFEQWLFGIAIGKSSESFPVVVD
jgi:hypothetical protein